MKITVMSRQEAIAHSYKKDVDKHVVISINCPDDTVPVFYTPSKFEDYRRHAILRLWFNDIDRPYENKEPKQGDFAGLKAFIDTYKDHPTVKEIIVHCAAGISRSSATAAAIAKYLGQDDVELIWRNTNYIPNKLVYKLACKELEIEMNDERIQELKQINKDERDLIELPIELEEWLSGGKLDE